MKASVLLVNRSKSPVLSLYLSPEEHDWLKEKNPHANRLLIAGTVKSGLTIVADEKAGVLSHQPGRTQMWCCQLGGKRFDLSRCYVEAQEIEYRKSSINGHHVFRTSRFPQPFWDEELAKEMLVVGKSGKKKEKKEPVKLTTPLATADASKLFKGNVSKVSTPKLAKTEEQLIDLVERINAMYANLRGQLKLKLIGGKLVVQRPPFTEEDLQEAVHIVNQMMQNNSEDYRLNAQGSRLIVQKKVTQLIDLEQPDG